MRSLILALIFLILVVVLFGVVRQNFSLKIRLVLAFLLLLLGVGCYLYVKDTAAQSSQTKELVGAFSSGKTLDCDGVNVSTKTHFLELGTQSFVAKQRQDFTGEHLSIQRCRVLF